ncbi:unnamed protein product [Vicia faba]|uniref:Uncharacterized protein n=1 Tax=Vicia faba TaxID=3906 RepID=A0AAV1AWR2_VICFA|nr:unnamed protein product [Vicia faba]
MKNLIPHEAPLVLYHREEEIFLLFQLMTYRKKIKNLQKIITLSSSPTILLLFSLNRGAFLRHNPPPIDPQPLQVRTSSPRGYHLCASVSSDLNLTQANTTANQRIHSENKIFEAYLSDFVRRVFDGGDEKLETRGVGNVSGCC